MKAFRDVMENIIDVIDIIDVDQLDAFFAGHVHWQVQKLLDPY